MTSTSTDLNVAITANTEPSRIHPTTKTVAADDATVPSFQLYAKPKSLTPGRCNRIVRYARKRLRGQDSNSEDAYDSTSIANTNSNSNNTKVISHSEIELGCLLGKGAFSSVYAIDSILTDRTSNNDDTNDNEDEDSNTNGLVVKFLRTKLYENHGLFAASAADLIKEGNILSTLSHTNVIRLHAVSSKNGMDAYLHGFHDAYFLVLERLECTLNDRISQWQDRHKELYLADQLDGHYDHKAQFVVECSSLNIHGNGNGRSPKRSSKNNGNWKNKLNVHVLRPLASRRSSRNGGSALEDSERTSVSPTCSCDGSTGDHEYGDEHELDGNYNKTILRKSQLLEERVNVTLQLADALAYLHEHKILHRDLKPDNIGFDAEGVLKVFDFDIARVVPNSVHYDNDNDDDNESSHAEDSTIFESSYMNIESSSSAFRANEKSEDELFHMTKKVGSPRYMSPECARREPYNLKADVYSYALLTHQILTLQKPYDDIADEDFDDLVFYKGVRPHIPLGLPTETKDLLRKAWSHDISKRPTMAKVRSAMAQQHFVLLRLGTMRKTSSSTTTTSLAAHNTAYVWSCSFECISDNNKMLRKILKRNKKMIEKMNSKTKTRNSKRNSKSDKSDKISSTMSNMKISISNSSTDVKSSNNNNKALIRVFRRKSNPLDKTGMRVSKKVAKAA